MSVLENGFEKSTQLGRQLFDLNNNTIAKFVELSSENFRKYLELNQNYVSKLPEVSDVSSFVELQREYGQNLWEGVQADLRARGEIVREAVEQTGRSCRSCRLIEPGLSLSDGLLVGQRLSNKGRHFSRDAGLLLFGIGNARDPSHHYCRATAKQSVEIPLLSMTRSGCPEIQAAVWCRFGGNHG
jgi:hypothetical protein